METTSSVVGAGGGVGSSSVSTNAARARSSYEALAICASPDLSLIQLERHGQRNSLREQRPVRLDLPPIEGVKVGVHVAPIEHDVPCTLLLCPNDHESPRELLDLAP